MKFKLSYGQVLALYKYFTELFNKEGQKLAITTMEARLCYLLMHNIYAKLHSIILPAGARPKPTYLLTLSEVEQLSFFLFFSHLPIPDEHAQAAMIIAVICNAINQHHV